MGLHERAAELYGDSELVLSSGDYPDTSGIETAFDNAVKWLHGKRVFGAAMLREKVIDSLVKETAAFLSEGKDWKKVQYPTQWQKAFAKV